MFADAPSNAIRADARGALRIPATTAIELATLLLLVALAVALARPELEGWSILQRYHELGGITGIFRFWISTPGRPLEPIPFAFAWLLGGGALAAGVVCGLLVAAKYLAARWAVARSLDGEQAWIAALLFTILPPWTDQWRFHGVNRELALVFMILGVGAMLRIRESDWRLAWPAAAAALVLLSLLTYEALALCAIVMPVFVVLAGGQPRAKGRLLFQLASSVAIAGIAYAAVFVYMRSWITGATGIPGYHSVIMARPDSPLDSPARLFQHLYHTAFVENPWGVWVLVLLPVILLGPSLAVLPRRAGRRAALATLAAILALPLLALPFAGTFYFLSDIERIGMPIGFGFALLCTALMARARSDGGRYDQATILIVGAVLLLGCAANAINCHRTYQVQRTLIKQIAALKPTQPLLVRDWTGIYGDAYTFQTSQTLRDALLLHNVSVDVVLCTASGVLVRHPTHWRLGSQSSITSCGVPPPGALVLDVRKPEATSPILVTAAKLEAR